MDYQNNAAITNLFITANRDARMGTVYDQYLAQWRAHGGQLFVHFNNVSPYGQYGSWGLLEYLDQTGSPKFNSAMNFIINNPCWWSGCASASFRIYLPLATR